MNREWTAEKVALRFEECVATLRKLPGERGLGYVNSWPEIKLDARELARQQAEPLRLKATPDQITRMEETLSWITWINHGERNLIWLRAYRTPWRAIARETGFPRSSAQRYWQGALLARAAEKGAHRALVDVGLEGEHAADDIRELRSLLQALNLAKRTAWQTFIRVITAGLLAALMAGIAIRFKFFGGQ